MNCLAEQAPIENSQVDVIVSEWMGYFLIFERMLPSVLSVRDKCLKKDGIIIPMSAKIILAAASCKDQPKPMIVSDEGDVLNI
jgi:predicted RNA methylase